MDLPSSEEEINYGDPSNEKEQNGESNENELSPNHRRGTTIDFHDLSSINAKPDKMYRSQTISDAWRSLDGLSEEKEVIEFPTGPDGMPLKIRVRVNGGNERQITSRGYVETQTGLEPVKSVISRFGGSVDWRSQSMNSPHKTQEQPGSAMRMAMLEVNKVHREIAQYKMKSETIETSTAELLKELENIKRSMGVIKTKLDKAEEEESKINDELNHAKHNLEVAEIFAREGGKFDQLDMVKKQHETAVSELKSVKEEIKSLKEECTTLAKEKENLVAKAEEAVLASKMAEKMVEELTEELTDVRKSLEIATVAKLEAEGLKASASLAKDEECLMWKKEIKEAEEELQQLNMHIALAKELEEKIEAGTSLLVKLNEEMEFYIRKLNRERDQLYYEEEEKRQEMLNSKSKEIEELKEQIEKLQGEVDVLNVEVSSLKTEVEKEKTELASLRQKAELASVTIPSLEAEFEETKQQIVACIEKEKEAKRKIEELPSLIEEATLETKQSKSVAQDAEDELKKVKEEAEPIMVSLKTLELKIVATTKEIEASKMSENIALAAIKALEESEMDTSSEKVTISLDEYFDLSKKGCEAAEQAQERLDAIMEEIETAKMSATNSLSMLYKVYSELDEKKKVLHEAKQKGHRETQSMMDAEQELKHLKENNEEHVELDKNEDANAADGANTEVTKPDMETNGDTRADEDNKKVIIEAVGESKTGLLYRVSMDDNFSDEGNNMCCLSGRNSYFSDDGGMTEFPSYDSPVVPVKKQKRNFFRKFWGKRKAKSVAG